MARQTASIQDAQAFSQLYERSHLIIYRFIYGMVGGPTEEVEDITAEAYLKAWKARHRFSGDEEAAVSWLIAISRNLVIDRYRRSKFQEYNLEEEIVRLDIQNDPNDPPEQRIEEQQQFHELWQMIQQLPIAQRELVSLRYLLGWRVNRIASHLGVPENTVSVQLKRILESLRKRRL